MLYHWLVQASLLIVKIQTDLDDQVDPIIEIGIEKKIVLNGSRGTWSELRALNFCLQVILDEHCDFLTRILKLVLSPKLRHLETDFTIDLRNFKNFQLTDQSLEEEEEEEQLEEQGIKVGWIH